MKKSEVAQLLAIMSGFDNRDVTPEKVEVWAELDTCKRYDFTTCRAAVMRFFNLTSTDRGESRYLDPQQFNRMAREVRVEQRREVDRLRAKIRNNIYASLIRSGKSPEEARATVADITYEADSMNDQGAAPAEIAAFLNQTKDRYEALAIEAGEHGRA